MERPHNPGPITWADIQHEDSMTREDHDLLRELILTAKMLHQNAVGCACQHYGRDCELHGLPGWLADAQKIIERAAALLVRPLPEPTERKT